MWPRLILAELALGADTLATGTAAGAVVFLAVHLIRRTRETDERRDDVAKFEVELAFAREARAWAERDRALEEAERARRERDQERARLDRMLERGGRGRPAPPLRRDPPRDNFPDPDELTGY